MSGSACKPPAQNGFRCPLRLILDTNVVLDLLFFLDPATAALRRAFETGRACCLTDARCREELCRVLQRPPFVDRPEAAQRTLLAYAALATLQPAECGPASAAALPRCRDPSDQKFLELAAASGADLLVTKDKALLRLARARSRLGALRILTPAAAAAALESETVQSRPRPGERQ